MCDFLCVCVCVCLCVCLCWCVEMGCAEVWLKFVCVLCGLTMAAGKLFSMAIFAKKNWVISDLRMSLKISEILEISKFLFYLRFSRFVISSKEFRFKT